MALTPSQVILFAADPDDLAHCLGAAGAAGIPLGNVLGNFESAWQYVADGGYLVIAVGGQADNALFYNTCGWQNPAGDGAGTTPFELATAPRDTLPGANYYVNAGGKDGADSLYIAVAYAVYAITGSYPTSWNSPPTPDSPADICSGEASVGSPCSACSYPAAPGTSCTSEQRTFINKFLGWAMVASARTGLPVNFILGHWGLETGWGTGGGLCDSCNNPGNLEGNGACSCAPVGSYATLEDGVNAYIDAMDNQYPFVEWAYKHYGLKEACMAIGAGCEPGSGYASRIYATSRYNGVTCNGQVASNNCYLDVTAANGEPYSSCAPTVTDDACDGCNGCGYPGCSLYETIAGSCLTPYDCVE